MGWLYGIGISLVFLLFVLCFFSSFSYFLHCHSNSQKKNITVKEFVQMPNCNLAEFIHNKWLQAAGYEGGDLYVITMNEYI